ncbi:MAG: glycosyltransferase [Prochlorococcus marinus XMU1428]|nr:glycosyltransferase [Prochlorococcus marinus XMU1428]
MDLPKKKIYIFGSSSMGGVRIITSSLRDSLKELGHSVEYIHGLKAIKFVILGIFNSTFTKFKKKEYFITWGIYNFIPLPKANTINFFHGFPSKTQQDFIRYYLFKIVILLVRIRRTKSISVSKYTSSILFSIYKIKTNTLRNSLPYSFLKKPLKTKFTKDIDIIFIGRATKFKLPSYLLFALEILAAEGFNIYIIGEGSSKNKYLLNNKNTKINFKNFISHNKCYQMLARSKYFISCSETEPFGIVFLEALFLGCRIISPRSGGALEISSLISDSYPNLFNFYDDEKSLINLLRNLEKVDSIDPKNLDKIHIKIKKYFDPIKHAEDVLNQFN